MKTRPITHKFVDSVPAEREPGCLYISIKYRTAIHDCFCDCGAKVVTPIRPAKWRLTFDGDTVSLSPSIGNSGHACGAHYWIDRGRAIPAGHLTDEQIEAGRRRDEAMRDAYYDGGVSAPALAAPLPPAGKKKGLLDRLLILLRHKRRF